MTTMDPEYTRHASIKMDVKDETTPDIKYTAHVPVKVDVKDETAHAPIKVDVKDETAHEQIKVDVKYETAQVPIKMDVKDEAAYVPIKVDVKDETAPAPIIVSVQDEKTHDLKYTVDAPIRVEVKDETAHVPMLVGVNDEAMQDLKHTAHVPIKVDVKDETKLDLKHTAHAPTNGIINEEIAHASIKAEIKIETTKKKVKCTARSQVKKKAKLSEDGIESSDQVDSDQDAVEVTKTPPPVLVRRYPRREIKPSASSRSFCRIRLLEAEEPDLESVACLSDADFDTVVGVTSETENSMPEATKHEPSLTREQTSTSFYDSKRHSLNLHQSNNNNKPQGLQTLSMLSNRLKFKCEYCPKEFLSPSVLKCHTQSHLNNGDEKLSEDPAESEDEMSPSSRTKPHLNPKEKLLHHQQKYENRTLYLCPEYSCGIPFTKIFNAKRHILRQHPKIANYLLPNITIIEPGSVKSEGSCSDAVPPEVSCTGGSSENSQTIDENKIVEDSAAAAAAAAASSSKHLPFKCLYQNCEEAFGTVTALRGHLITHFDAGPPEKCEQGHSKKRRQDHSRERPQDRSQDHPQNPPKDPPQEPPPDSSHDPPPDPPQEPPPDPPQETHQDTPQEPPQDQPEVPPQDTPQDPPQDPPRDTTQDTSQERNFRCSKEGCAKAFTRVDNLRRHIRLVHKPDKSAGKSFAGMPVLTMEID